MTKNQILTIEIVVIAVLVLLLALKLQRKSERNEWLEEGEHGVVEVLSPTRIKTPDGRIIIIGDETDPIPTEPVEPTPTGEGLMTDEERKVAALSPENLARYRAATDFQIPEGIPQCEGEGERGFQAGRNAGTV